MAEGAMEEQEKKKARSIAMLARLTY